MFHQHIYLKSIFENCIFSLMFLCIFHKKLSFPPCSSLYRFSLKVVTEPLFEIGVFQPSFFLLLILGRLLRCIFFFNMLKFFCRPNSCRQNSFSLQNQFSRCSDVTFDQTLFQKPCVLSQSFQLRFKERTKGTNGKFITCRFTMNEPTV